MGSDCKFNAFPAKPGLQPLPVKHDTFKIDKTRKLGHLVQFT